MQIIPSNGFSAVNPTVTGAASASAQGGSKPGGRVDAAAGGEDSTFTPTPDLARLLESVRQLSDVRPEVVEAAKDAVASGDLLTPAASADAARVMLGGEIPTE